MNEIHWSMMLISYNKTLTRNVCSCNIGKKIEENIKFSIWEIVYSKLCFIAKHEIDVVKFW